MVETLVLVAKPDLLVQAGSKVVDLVGLDQGLVVSGINKVQAEGTVAGMIMTLVDHHLVLGAKNHLEVVVEMDLGATVGVEVDLEAVEGEEVDLEAVVEVALEAVVVEVALEAVVGVDLGSLVVLDPVQVVKFSFNKLVILELCEKEVVVLRHHVLYEFNLYKTSYCLLSEIGFNLLNLPSFEF
jgi:hypothetical protein